MRTIKISVAYVIQLVSVFVSVVDIILSGTYQSRIMFKSIWRKPTLVVHQTA